MSFDDTVKRASGFVIFITRITLVVRSGVVSSMRCVRAPAHTCVYVWVRCACACACLCACVGVCLLQVVAVPLCSAQSLVYPRAIYTHIHVYTFILSYQRSCRVTVSLVWRRRDPLPIWCSTLLDCVSGFS